MVELRQLDNTRLSVEGVIGDGGAGDLIETSA
jgi:hypothetical protein